MLLTVTNLDCTTDILCMRLTNHRFIYIIYSPPIIQLLTVGIKYALCEGDCCYKAAITPGPLETVLELAS